MIRPAWLNNRALLAACSSSFVMIVLVVLLPGIRVSSGLIFAMTLAIPTAIVIYRAMNGDFFTILTLYSAIFVWEGLGYLLKVIIADSQTRERFLSSPGLVEKTFVVLLISYILFLIGYFVVPKAGPRRRTSNPGDDGVSRAPASIVLPDKKWIQLSLLIAVTLLMSFVKVYMRIKAAGGLNEYLSTMYLYRFGTYAEDLIQNSWTALANNIGSISLALVCLGLIYRWKTRTKDIYWYLIRAFMVLTLISAFASSFRSTVIFSVMALIAVYASVRRVQTRRLVPILLLMIPLLVAINYVHQYLYYSTAGWEYQDLSASLGRLVTPQEHVETLEQVLDTEGHAERLRGKTLLESVLFFIPRVFWKVKAPEYSTLAVQRWAGFPVSYQIAVTNVGELIAHFGLLGLIGMIGHGVIHGFLESIRFRNIAMMSGYYGIVLPRLLTHLGMGIGAVSITLFQMAVLFLVTKALHLDDRIVMRPDPIKGSPSRILQADHG